MTYKAEETFKLDEQGKYTFFQSITLNFDTERLEKTEYLFKALNWPTLTYLTEPDDGDENNESDFMEKTVELPKRKARRARRTCMSWWWRMRL